MNINSKLAFSEVGINNGSIRIGFHQVFDQERLIGLIRIKVGQHRFVTD